MSIITDMATIINWNLQDGNLKEWLRKYYCRYFNYLYPVNEIVDFAHEDNGILTVRLSNGIVLSVTRNRSAVVPCNFHYARKEKLDKIGNSHRFNTFFQILNEQFIEDCYQRMYVLKPGDVVVDVGANIGAFTVKAALAVGDSGKVFAIEPELHNRQMLERNIHDNGLRNVQIVPMGAWSSKKELPLYISDTIGGHTFNEESRDNRKTQEMCQLDTLDSILAKLGITNVDFIKMDIEGAEIEAIKGAHDLLVQCSPQMAIAAYHIVDGKPTFKELSKQLRNIYGYKTRVSSDGILYAV